MGQRSNLVLIVCILVGTIVLCALGTWQVQRLYWKEELIARVNERVASAPVSLASLQENGFDKDTQEYQRVSTTGIFDHSKEVYFFTTAKNGGSGWNVHAPLTLEDGTNLIVNRGFVPFEMKEPEKRGEGQVTGQVEISGLLRFPLREKPFGSLENDLAKREFFWRNVSEMAQVMGLDGDILPVILDADEKPNPGGWPRGDTTILNFSNNHLQYAVTWYGLALTLLGVGGYFLFSRRQVKHDP